MAIFQFHMQIIKRSEGRSVVAAAAYRSAQKIENQYTGITEDYTNKKWVVHREILLPEQAPEEFRNRDILWNSVEQAEKSRDARLAREVEIALPLELSLEENIHLVQEFVQDTFVSDGMIADICIHCPPVTNEQHIPVNAEGQITKDENEMVFQNPHAHILLTVRPLDQNGRWQAKAQKEYLCKRQNETAAFTAEEYLHAKNDGWEKQYPYWKGREKVWRTPSEAYVENLVRVSNRARSTPYGRRNEKIEYWNSKDAVFAYRKSWEDHVNQALERAGRPERVDCRSYETQGIEDTAGIHLGSHASRQKDSERFRIQADIRELNRRNREIRKSLDTLKEQVKEKNARLSETIAEHMGRLRGEILSARYQLEHFQKKRDSMKKEAHVLRDSVSRVTSALENIRKKDRQAGAELSRLSQEQKKTFPVWSSRPGEIQEEITKEQEGIRFRRERLGRILAEEGFQDIQDYQDKANLLSQMDNDLQALDQKITACEEQIQEHTRRYEKLCSQIPEDVSCLAAFREAREKWSHIYGQRASDRILQKDRKINSSAFHKVLRETDYALNQTLYLSGRAGYLLGRMESSTQQMVEENRGRIY